MLYSCTHTATVGVKGLTASVCTCVYIQGAGWQFLYAYLAVFSHIIYDYKNFINSRDRQKGLMNVTGSCVRSANGSQISYYGAGKTVLSIDRRH